ncbi:thioesterase II family protein [Paenibacillus ehimensis]|uniref:thioesterase II family protein n=1 Tax=Paenibacillus ehimensis TaxID=79264 RepID=UPI000471E381|nr:alpha/beta fold hydrolase [Paenibacillus ehimensis]
MNRIDLYCIPYAGGSGHAIYGRWAEELDPRIQLHPLELAGHGRRMGQTLDASVATAVADMLRTLRPRIAFRPYAIYGHSMGTVLAYELAAAIREAGLPEPVALFQSGRLPPHHAYLNNEMHLLPDEVFLDKIKRLGGTPPELFESKELVRLFLPILRNDYRMIEQYRCKLPHARFDANVVFLYSDDDPLVTKPYIYDWEQYTASSFEVHAFRGGHFFLNEHWQDICRVINRKLSPVLEQPVREVSP